MIGAPPTQATDRFRADLEAMVGPFGAADRIGVAVSGGPDSLALLLLTQAAYPGRVWAATVDHRLRPESADEAGFVADVAVRIGVPHVTLKADWPEGPPRNGVQEAARDARYAALLRWCADQRLDALLTAHHADDQAETLLMRLARGAGLPGLVGIRPSQEFGSCRLLRPLLGWRSYELVELCRDAGLAPIDDPSNADPRHERSRVRKLLRAADSPDPEKIALSAAHLLEVEEAMLWLLDEVVRTRVEIASDRVIFDADGLPHEVKRRVLALLAERSGANPRGAAVARAVDRLEQGRPATLAGLRFRPGERWTVATAPRRRAN